MQYQSMQACVDDLEQNNHLVRIRQVVDPDLEMAEIHRRVFANKGPAIFFERVKGSRFPAVSNLFGTMARTRFIFRHTLRRVKMIMQSKAQPLHSIRKPWQYLSIPLTLLHAIPQKTFSAPVLEHQTQIDKLPLIKSWPDDGGAFILLPQVYSEDPEHPGIMNSNIGMYRIQLTGNKYKLNKEIGLHYQIRRDIGIHHKNAINLGVPLKVSIFIGGPPAHTFAAVMPLPEKKPPEGIPEICFAGALAGRRFRYYRQNDYLISADADFCITGTVLPGEMLPEGPFGDHIGYYSLKHNYPVIAIDSVYHRTNAIWPFTIVGRPPQEDINFATLVHEITSPVVPTSLPGVKSIHAVAEAGVHPLLLALARERYLPQKHSKPMELLTIANSILGFGHCSLAKYLMIAAWDDNPQLDVRNIEDFFKHVLERVDWSRDLHFQTKTTIDSLDYSGTALNEGSKVIIAAAGEKKRDLAVTLQASFQLSQGFCDPSFVIPGILVLTAPPYSERKSAEKDIHHLCRALEKLHNLNNIPLLIISDDSEFTSRTLHNFLWITFTRSNPATDIHGVKSFIEDKHWGCHGPLIIDARLKPHHAPPLVECSKITKKVNELGKKGQPLYGII